MKLAEHKAMHIKHIWDKMHVIFQSVTSPAAIRKLEIELIVEFRTIFVAGSVTQSRMRFYLRRNVPNNLRCNKLRDKLHISICNSAFVLFRLGRA
jgi:hypothetical protein